MVIFNSYVKLPEGIYVVYWPLINLTVCKWEITMFIYIYIKMLNK